ncbi:MAG: hypothetical protein LBK42_09030 [Propionibacteriaceae bacterium]|jgi:hypothetical protein|nr:hypothetical protein [Propionibacteriaceae bacterium]
MDLIADISRFFTPLVGVDVWGSELGYGSFLTMSFGPPREDEPRMGQYFLWIFCCSWRIEEGDVLLAACEDDRETMAWGAERLNGERVERVTVYAPSLSLTIEFSGGLRLETFSIYNTSDYEHWMLYMPSQDVLTAGPGSLWSVEAGDKSPSDDDLRVMAVPVGLAEPETETEDSVSDISLYFTSMMGVKAWGAELGTNGLLVVNFGLPNERDPEYGQYSLWIDCDWSVEDGALLWAVSGDGDEGSEEYGYESGDKEALARAVEILNGKPIKGVAVHAPSLSLTIDFGGGLRLKTFSIRTLEHNHWWLYMPGAKVLRAGPGSSWSVVDEREFTAESGA